MILRRLRPVRSSQWRISLLLILLPALLGITSIDGSWTINDTCKVAALLSYVLVMALIVGAIVLIRRVIIPPRYRSGRCSQCGYDLTGNTSGVCPECGTLAGRSNR